MWRLATSVVLGIAGTICATCTIILLAAHSQRLQAEVSEAALFIMSHEGGMQNPLCWLHRDSARGPFRVRRLCQNAEMFSCAALQSNDMSGRAIVDPVPCMMKGAGR